MIIEFSISNYLSFKDSVTLSMVASNPVKELEGKDDELNNVFYDSEKKMKFLKSAVLYGANGSGKSNLISAIAFFKSFILKSSNNNQSDDGIKIMPFLLNSETEKSPSSFEMIFIINDIRYRYGFEVTNEEVVSEWLFALNVKETTKESYYFSREFQKIKVNPKTFKEGKGVESRTRQDALFLSSVAQWNGGESIAIQNWFRKNINTLSGINDSTMEFTIEKFQENPVFRKRIIDFIKLADIGIEDIRIEEKIFNELFAKSSTNEGDNEKINSLIEELQKAILEANGKEIKRKEIIINSYHKKYDSTQNLIDLAVLKFGLESVGTQKLFALLGPWFDTLEEGKILIIDELDCSMHTKLTTELIKVFQSKANAKNAQLIFASHDTNLLRNDLFRRDQIWFTEKNNETGSSDLYSLVEYKINHATSVRNDASFEKDYLLGKYGAIPYFGNISQFINDFVKDAEHE